jgi:transcriptional regulator with XRE-family HTH domain
MALSDKPAEAALMGRRLYHERKNAGLTQEQCAEVGGVKRRTQLAYESGDSVPDALYLQRLHSFSGGANRIDIFYVVTGRRVLFATRSFG